MSFKKNTTSIEISEIGKDIIYSLLYYDIFKYPLNAIEVFHNSNIQGITQDAINNELDLLVERGLVYIQDGHYLLTDQEPLVEKRLLRNERAQKMIPKAIEMSKLIGSFPFVRAVFISGSLSKNSMDEDGDIDFFIITTPNRLWLCRALLVLYKKLFLAGSHKYFCINYFIDTKHLEIQQKNIFTATEIVTLLPMYGAPYYHSFMNDNQWTKSYFPNYPLRLLSDTSDTAHGFIKRTVEILFQNSLGNWLDQKCMNLFSGYWNKMYKDYTKDALKASLTVNKHASKNHPKQFQKRILEWYQKKITSFEKEHNINLKG